MNINYILYNSDSKEFFLDPIIHKEANLLTPSVYTIHHPDEELLDTDKFQYYIRKDVFEKCGIKITNTANILSFSTITYNGEKCFMYVIDVTNYIFTIKEPRAYPVHKEKLLKFIDDIRALAIYARFSLLHKV